MVAVTAAGTILTSVSNSRVVCEALRGLPRRSVPDTCFRITTSTWRRRMWRRRRWMKETQLLMGRLRMRERGSQKWGAGRRGRSEKEEEGCDGEEEGRDRKMRRGMMLTPRSRRWWWWLDSLKGKAKLKKNKQAAMTNLPSTSSLRICTGSPSRVPPAGSTPQWHVLPTKQPQRECATGKEKRTNVSKALLFS